MEFDVICDCFEVPGVCLAGGLTDRAPGSDAVLASAARAGVVLGLIGGGAVRYRPGFDVIGCLLLDPFLGVGLLILLGSLCPAGRALFYVAVMLRGVWYPSLCSFSRPASS